MAWFHLTCPFSLDWQLAACAHAQKDVNADVGVIGGAGRGRGGCKVVIEGAVRPPCHVPAHSWQPGPTAGFPSFPIILGKHVFFQPSTNCCLGLRKKTSILLTKSKGAFIAKRILDKGHVSISYGPTGPMKFLCLD